MSFGSIVFTNRGKTLQAKAQSGAQLVFTRLAMGDGSLTGQSIRDITNLINHKKTIPITRIHHYVDGTAKVGGVLTNQDMVQGFYWREIGLFAMDPDIGEVLYCYGNAAELAEYIPPGDGSQIIERVAEVIAIIGNAANVSAIINSSLVYLTMEDFEAHNTSNTAHQDIRQQISAQSGQISDWLDIVGNKAGLLTSVKTNIVAAINSLLTLASTTVNGLMSKEDKTKLNSIAENANNYVHPGSGTNPHGTTKTDVGLGSVQNYGIATTSEAQAGTATNKYMTPALVSEACKRFGGDIVGKVYSYELISQTLSNGVEATMKNYTNAKGGMIRALFNTYNVSITYRIVIDGVTAVNGVHAHSLLSLGYSEQMSYIALDLPFNNNIQIYVLYSAGTTISHTMKLHYYTNP